MSPQKAFPPPPWTLYLLIFLTGFTFLSYEVSWNRLLSLLLGATVSAATIVLATFMAGFGVGALVWGRWANQRHAQKPLLGGILLGIAFFSGLNYLLLTHLVPGLYSSLLQSGNNLGRADTVVFLLVSALLFIPAFFMGGVFPLVGQLVVAREKEMGRVLGRLYALETLGSTLGGLVTGFLLLGRLGQQRTLLVSVGINLVLAGWLWLGSGLGSLNEKSTPPEPDPSPLKTNQRSLALLGTFLCGFSILALQVLWMRMFRIYLTNTSYTFALVSSVAILGLFLGSALFSRRPLDNGPWNWSLFKALLGLMLTTGAGLILLLNLPQMLMFPFASVMGSPAARALALPLIASLLIIFPPAAFSGYAFPLACRMYASGTGNLSREVGLVLAINTFGSVLGPLVAAFLLLPWLGSVRSVLLIMVFLGLGALVVLGWRTAKGAREYYRNFLAAGIGILLLMMVVSPSWRILPPSFSRYNRDVLYYRESVEGTLSVGQDRNTRSRSKYTYVNNSAVIGSTYDAVKVVKMVGHFPFLLGLDAQEVLVIGFGIGVTTSAIASHPEVRNIDCVELVPGLQKAAQYYRHLNHGIVDDPRLNIIAGDGRHFLQNTARKYDLISCDPTHPILGSGNLYTADYFRQCREHLKPGGMVSQYLPLHKLRPEDFLGIIRTFESVFPHSTVWLGHYHAVLLGGLNELQIPFQTWSDNVQRLAPDNDFYINAYHLAATLFLDGPAIARLGADSPLNTDDRSYTEFFNLDCLREDNIGRNLKWLAESRLDPANFFQDIPRIDLMEKYLAGNRLLTESLEAKLAHDNQRSLDLLKKAVLANPEDQEFPFLIKLYY